MKRLIALVLTALLLLNFTLLTSCDTKSPQEKEGIALLLEASELCENKIDIANKLISLSSSKEACTTKNIYFELAKVFDCDKKVFARLEKNTSRMYDASSLASSLKNFPQESVLTIVKDCYDELGLTEKINSKISDAKNAIFQITESTDNYDILTGYYKKIIDCNNLFNSQDNIYKKLDQLTEKLDEHKMALSSFKMKLA